MQRYLLFALAAFIACTSAPTEEVPTVNRFTHIKDEKARAIVRESIQHAGGIDRWESIKKLSYTKDFSLILESGEIEVSYQQVHDYQYHPMKIDIRSTENGVLIHTILEDGKYSRIRDGEVLEVSQETLAKAVNTSTYVVSMPFKLLDPGIDITYEGEITLSDGKTVDVLKVAYDAEKNKNHSTSDIWKYYFDKDDGRIVANGVQTGDHFSFLENVTYERVNGILFNKERKSYRVDSLGNKLYLRAYYNYDNYQVE